MSLKNPFHTQLAIAILLADEDTLDAKLNLLTEISLSSTNQETFKICEGFRERICGEEVEKVRTDNLPAIHKGQAFRSARDEKCP